MITQDQMIEVMAYADGELDGDDLERIRVLTETDPEAKELLASLRAIGDGVRRSYDVGDIDIRDVVMQKLLPNELDKARIRRTARTRVAVVGASLVALAAAILFYVRDVSNGTTSGATKEASAPQTILASANATGVEVDFVDTPSVVSVFYVPASTSGADEEGNATEAPSVVVWVNDKEPETTP